MRQMGLGLAWFQGINPDALVYFIPIVGTIMGTLMVVAVVWLVVHYKQRMQEMEHTLQLRRMEHERRMKELELELARVQSGMAATR